MQSFFSKVRIFHIFVPVLISNFSCALSANSLVHTFAGSFLMLFVVLLKIRRGWSPLPYRVSGAGTSYLATRFWQEECIAMVRREVGR